MTKTQSEYSPFCYGSFSKARFTRILLCPSWENLDASSSFIISSNYRIKLAYFPTIHSFLSNIRSQVDPKPLLEAISLKEVCYRSRIAWHKSIPTNPREVRMVVDQAILLRSRNPLLHALPFSRGRPFAAQKQYFIFSLAHSVAPARTGYSSLLPY